MSIWRWTSIIDDCHIGTLERARKITVLGKKAVEQYSSSEQSCSSLLSAAVLYLSRFLILFLNVFMHCVITAPDH